MTNHPSLTRWDCTASMDLLGELNPGCPWIAYIINHVHSHALSISFSIQHIPTLQSQLFHPESATHHTPPTCSTSHPSGFSTLQCSPSRRWHGSPERFSVFETKLLKRRSCRLSPTKFYGGPRRNGMRSKRR